MILDEQIEKCEKVAEQYMEYSQGSGLYELGRAWAEEAQRLKKLREAYRLLLLACSDIHSLLTDAELNTKNCAVCGKLAQCNEYGTCKGGGVWKYEVEVMRLIGEEANHENPT